MCFCMNSNQKRSWDGFHAQMNLRSWWLHHCFMFMGPYYIYSCSILLVVTNLSKSKTYTIFFKFILVSNTPWKIIILTCTHTHMVIMFSRRNPQKWKWSKYDQNKWSTLLKKINLLIQSLLAFVMLSWLKVVYYNIPQNASTNISKEQHIVWIRRSLAYLGGHNCNLHLQT
jgi:hypothetical protein